MAEKIFVKENIKLLITQKNIQIKFLKQEIKLLKKGLPFSERKHIKVGLLPIKFLQEVAKK